MSLPAVPWLRSAQPVQLQRHAAARNYIALLGLGQPPCCLLPGVVEPVPAAAALRVTRRVTGSSSQLRHTAGHYSTGRQCLRTAAQFLYQKGSICLRVGAMPGQRRAPAAAASASGSPSSADLWTHFFHFFQKNPRIALSSVEATIWSTRTLAAAQTLYW
jgi:hypothetical protein